MTQPATERSAPHRRRFVLIGIRSALLVIVPAAFTLTSGGVDAWWWLTAQSNSRMLAGTLNRQIVEQVKQELSSLIAGAEATHGAIRTILSHGVLACLDALARADLRDDRGHALKVRIGINSGLVRVGNVGTACGSTARSSGTR